MSKKLSLNILHRRMKDLSNVLEIQGDNTFGDDAYMVGLYNGIELGLATMEGREPVYRKVSKKSIKKYNKDIQRRFKKPKGE
ncbi:hypothetical protein [Bacillus sp. KH172YL63]|uniref:hypothetical protein n=1 Tax=Bacillus sp. KH172YL63 TaxID=2709784 RepID=UPI0013E4A2C8|nr:hypothetical protein [Bacillus sp. KH172YL63]BCB03513.1 hypothetical protein KH172YL63_16460 [Bacillus sp. KH172YL63]